MIPPQITASLALIVTAIWPFAVVSDAVTAGIFSIVNTVLNGITLYMLNRTMNKVRATHDAAEEAADLSALVARRSDSPRNEREREND